jgi:excisionase family DNA binding protein
MSKDSATVFPDLLTVEEVAGFFKISNNSVYRMVESRIIPFYKIIGGLRFKREDLLQYLESQRIKPKDEWFYIDKHKSHKKISE